MTETTRRTAAGREQGDAKREDRKINLGQRMMFMSIFVSLGALFIGTWVLYYFYHTSYTEKTADYLKAFVERHARDIDTYLTARVRNIKMETAIYSVDQFRESGALRTKLDKLQSVYPGVFDDLGLIDPGGTQVAYAGPYKLVEANYATADWFRQAVERENFVSDVFLGIRRIPHFIVTSRISADGKPWLLRATVNFTAFNQLVKAIHVGETGAAFIINRKGEFQTERRSDIAVEPAVLSLLAKDRQPGFNARYVEHEGGDGEDDYVFVSAPLKGGDWILVFQQSKNDALVNLYNARFIAIAISLLGTLGIVFTVVVLSNRMQRTIVQAEETQEVMEKQMVETGKLAAIGELAAGIAHEINNPVAIMVESAGWCQDLMKFRDFTEEKNVKEIEESLTEIVLQGRRCKDITHKLLSFARRTDPRTSPVDLYDLLTEIISLSVQKARLGNIRIDKEFDEGLPKVTASPTELQQVVLNLLNNAIDATHVDHGHIVVRAHAEADSVVIDVQDNGDGIPPANLARIFEPFYTTKPVGKGTGLGLAICFGVVNKMGGEITVESELNVGTTFHVRIPVTPKED